MFRSWIASLTVIAFLAPLASGQAPETPASFIRDNYTRRTYQIPMRDGVRLYTIVYSPKNTAQKYPILMLRSPYGIPPYDEEKYRYSLGPNRHFAREGYIFVYQDVRGCYMSEGKFENMRPQVAKSGKAQDVDESTDTYDTIDYLVKNVPNHNGKVGLYGISYPGFYAAAGMINAHPALKAVSPQAPIADWYFDDFFHNGAFFLSHAYPFFSGFGIARPELTMNRPSPLSIKAADGYKYFLDMGSLKNSNKPGYYNNLVPFWNTMMEHPTYDKFWQDRNLLPHLKNVAPAVMTVGGWFDAEDLYGTFSTYRAIEKQNPGIFNVLVVGPWSHGGWSREDASKLGNVYFGSNTADFYQREIELPFFNHYLKGKGEHRLPEAFVFETGSNQWHKYNHWPPKEVQPRTFFLGDKNRLTGAGYVGTSLQFDSFVSDPHKPVPTCERIALGMPQAYMTDDMRFASRRPDVLTYQTEVLEGDLTLAGPIQAELYVSTTGTDADWIVKVIDVFGDDTPGIPGKDGRELAGYQMHVRSEVIRGRYRDSFAKPAPFVPNRPTKISLTLQDVLHTFKKGHRLMVQIHSSWFPLIDRNPQKYVPNIFFADDDDFIVATHRVYRSQVGSSQIRVGVLPASR